MGKGLHVTAHAVLRYQQRVEQVSEDIVRVRLSGRAFDCALTMDADVILPTGHRAVIRDGAVVTILPSGQFAARNHKHGDQ